MINLSNVTLVCVSSIKINSSIQALVDSMSVVKFYDVKFITDIDANVSGIKTEKCEKIKTIHEYNDFMIYDLHKYIESDFCLVVQYDSRIIHPDMWNDEFLSYDYIGAPWPIPGTEWRRNATLVNSDNVVLDKFDDKYRVGNGGFSLRSRRLLTTPLRINIPKNNRNEDVLISIYYRHLYEQDGNVFAPFEVANKFSKEWGNHKTFGKHRGFDDHSICYI